MAQFDRMTTFGRFDLMRRILIPRMILNRFVENGCFYGSTLILVVIKTMNNFGL